MRQKYFFVVETFFVYLIQQALYSTSYNNVTRMLLCRIVARMKEDEMRLGQEMTASRLPPWAGLEPRSSRGSTCFCSATKYLPNEEDEVRLGQEMKASKVPSWAGLEPRSSRGSTCFRSNISISTKHKDYFIGKVINNQPFKTLNARDISLWLNNKFK